MLCRIMCMLTVSLHLCFVTNEKSNNFVFLCFAIYFLFSISCTVECYIWNASSVVEQLTADR